jgi:PKD repeat protein
MHLTVNAGPANSWNLIWDKYEGFAVPTYRIWRSDSTQNFVLIDSVQGSSFTYSDINPSSGGLYYAVEVVKPGGPCIATSNNKASTNYNSSRSNHADNGLIILQPLYTNFFAYPATGIRPLHVQFYDDSDPSVIQWQWQFGDGDSSKLKNPMHIYDTVGVFEVSLRTSDGSIFNTHTKYDYITVLPVGVEEYEILPELVVAPNPFREVSNVRFSIFYAADVKIEVYNLLGELVSVPIIGSYGPGTYTMPLSITEMGHPAGIYLLRFTAGKKTITQRIVQVR